MGHFFVMSTRFNKCAASDFGLLPLAEDMALNPDDFGKLVKVFRLDSPVNRSPVLRKTYAQIQQDSRRWREIADLAKGVKCKSCRSKSST